MKAIYETWIDIHAPRARVDAMGQCRAVSEKMLSMFPELKLVRGHHHCMIWGEREHWWLVDEDGGIVDPTAIQFPSKGGGRYVEFPNGGLEPIGCCINCGDYCYDGEATCTSVCSKKCDDELMLEFM